MDVWMDVWNKTREKENTMAICYILILFT